MPLSHSHHLTFLLRDAYRYADVVWARWRRRRPRTLPTLLLFVTYRCNLQCAMCGVRYQPRNRELDLADYQNILDRAQRLHCSLMLVSGGEALARGDVVYELIRMGRERGIAAHLCSNGLLIDEKAARRLQESGLRSVSISLESPDRDVHDRIRGAGSYDQAVAALTLLRIHAPQVQTGINCTLTALNYRHLAAWPPFAESLGAHQLKFAPVHVNLLHREKPPEEFAPLQFSDDQLTALAEEIVELRQALKKSRLLTNHPRYLKHLAASIRKAPSFNCYAGYAACTIDPYGNVSPCPDLDAGLSLHEQPLDAIWRGDAYHALRQRVCTCGRGCWDPLYTEMSLRLAPTSVWRGVRQVWRERQFYFGAPAKTD